MPSHAYSEYITQVVKDLRRTVDYLETRDDIDDQRLAYYGMSWGGVMSGVDPRGRGAHHHRHRPGRRHDQVGLPEINPLNYLPRVNVPLLMMNQIRHLPQLRCSALPMFEMISTPVEHKVIKIYPTDHIPSKVDDVTETSTGWTSTSGPPIHRKTASRMSSGKCISGAPTEAWSVLTS